MSGAASSDPFFADVRRFFALLDLDGDGGVDWHEATLGLSHCFDAVHRVHSPSSSASTTAPPPLDDAPPVSAAHKAQTVANQVQWLFSATQHSPPTSPPTPLALSDFELCYQRLLQSAYEQEVLHLDLKRAIDALSSSPQWTAMRAILTRARRLWVERMAEGGGGEGGEEGRVVEGAMERSLRSLSEGGSATFASPKKAAAVRRMVEGIKARGRAISAEQWMRAWQEIVAVDFRHQRVIEDLDQALAE